MTFGEIEELLGEKLPASKQYPAWWSNNPSNNPMTKEWLAAGFQRNRSTLPAKIWCFDAPWGSVRATGSGEVGVGRICGTPRATRSSAA